MIDLVLLDPEAGALASFQENPLVSTLFVGSEVPPALPGVEWLPGPPVLALHHALLLARHDVLCVGPGVQLPASSLSLLRDALAAGDRQVAAVATPVEALGAPAILSGLPAAAEVFGVDVACVLLRHDALALVGGLEPSFQTVTAALTDWTLRAQRLGFVTVRALRAPCTAAEAHFPEHEALDHRHPVWPGLRALSREATAPRLTRNLLRRSLGRLEVALDLRYLPADVVNGTVVYARELCRGLAAQPEVSVRAIVEDEAQRQVVQSFGVETTLSAEPLPPAQVIHRPAQLFDAPSLAWLLRFPASLVVTFQDLIAWRVPSVFGSVEQFERFRALSRLALRSSQGVLALSEHNRHELLTEFSLEEAAVHLVPHGVDAQALGSHDERANRALLSAAGVEGRFFFYGGADFPHKNHRVMLAAFAQLRGGWSDGPPPTLVFTGQTSGTPGGVYPVLTERLPPGVRFLGQVDEPLLRALYQETIALLYPSLYEGFGLPLLEAMASGVPVITSRYASLPEVAGDAALFVEPLTDTDLADAMRAVASDEGLRARLSSAGRTRAARFTWAETIRRTLAAYEAALRAPSAQSLQERRFAAQL